VVALSNVLADRPTLAYAVVSALIILSNTSLLGLLFLPKVLRFWEIRTVLFKMVVIKTIVNKWNLV